jgi:signal transduction histidine kinase
MRVSDTILLTDRIVIIMRWLILVGFLILLPFGALQNLQLTSVFITVGIWNVTLSILALLKIRIPLYRYIVSGVDLVLAILLFVFGGGMGSTMVWTGVLPLLSAGLYFGLWGSVGMSIVIVVAFLSVSMPNHPLLELLSGMGVAALVYLLTGIGLGFVCRQVNAALDTHHLNELGKQQEVRQKERERIKALYEITSTLGATLNYQRVLDLALDLAAKTLDDTQNSAVQLVGAFYLYETDMLYPGSARRYTPADMRVSLPGVSGLIGKAIERGEPLHARNPGEDSELSRIVALRPCQSYYCFPLRTGLDVYGVLVFGHPNPEYFTDIRLEILEIIGQQAKSALQNATLYHEIEIEKKRMIEIQGEGQKKLARDLHDGPTQSVAAIAMRVNFARRLVERDPKAAAEELYKIEDLARRTTKEIRHMLFTLRPLVLESSGLIAALKANAEKMNETYGQNVIIKAEQAAVDQLEMGKQGIIFYIAEEAINNARKHAEAEHIWVRVVMDMDDVVLLEVQDDGVGFNVGEMDAGYEQRGSLGMVNMRERAELVNGILRLDSAEGKGTYIRLWVPLTENAAERIRHGTIKA